MEMLKWSLDGVLRAALLAIVLFILGLPDAARAAPGDLDPTFGSGGKVTTDFGGVDTAFSVALQPDGKLVVAGTSNGRFALARYNPDGSLDSAFGSGGKVVTSQFSGGSFDIAHAVLLQPDGKIIAAGKSTGVFALARYNTDGSLDGSFGSGGKVATDFGVSSAAFALALQPDGKMVVAGAVLISSISEHFALARYHPDGSLDGSFGSGGKVTTAFTTASNEVSEALALALQPDGKIVVAGESFFAFALARYNPDGSLDATFDGNGKVTTVFPTFSGATALALQPDGSIVAAGSSSPTVASLLNRNFALARYHPDGSLDASFGSGGKVTTDFGGGDVARAVALQPDGKIVVAGGSTGPPGHFAVARYNADGSLDATFGVGGKVITDPSGGDARSLALQSDGKIVAAGSSNFDFALARYKGDPIPTVSIATNQPVYHAGDHMTVTITTDPGETTDRWYLVVALVSPVNTAQDPFFIYRFNPVVELITFQTALSRLSSGFGEIAARPLSPVANESFVILDLILPALPVGAYQWLTALFSENLSRTSNVAGASFAFE